MMKNNLLKYPVQHPLLKKYIKFFWELQLDDAQLNHQIIPQRNINLRINLSETPHFLLKDSNERILEDIYFLGLQDHSTELNLKIDGKVFVLGICFYPDGFYPFIKIPVAEFKNQLLGANEAGLMLAENIGERLKEAADISARLAIIEQELVSLLDNRTQVPDQFHQFFNALGNCGAQIQLADFCKRNNSSIRQLERMFNKYIGVSANTYSTLNRFHHCVNQMLQSDYSRLSDLAYDNGYFDQMHFIKDFKRFAGDTPKRFVQQNNSLLQIAKLH